MGFRSDNKCFKNFINTATRWENGKIGKFTYDTIIPNIPFECRFEEMDSEMKTYIIKSSIERANSEILGRGFIISLLVMRLWPEVDRATTLFRHYYQKSISANANLTDKQFNNQFLQKENEYYLYTKKKLFPFFNDEACEKITDYTREFFEYAREQGCVGEFVEDDVYKVDERLIKVDKILSAYKYEDKIDDYNIKLIKDAIQHFTYDNRIEIGIDIVKLKKGENIEFTYYLMTSCFFAIYSESYNSSDRERWCRLCGALFDKGQKTWNSHWNDNSKISREFMRKIESYYK